MSCSDHPDLSEYIKKSDLLTDVGKLTLSIEGKSPTGIPIDETVDIQYVTDLSKCSYKVLSDSLTEFSFHIGSDIEFSTAAEVHITKKYNDYTLTYFRTYFTRHVEKNKYIDFQTIYTIYHSLPDITHLASSKLHSFDIESFDKSTGNLIGKGHLTSMIVIDQYYEDTIPSYEIEFSFDLILKEKIEVK
ncbi:MAG: hypothetical protein MI922_21165 [Bacteroidales bacterium]|nr:hypothetical protein [Bacteroidales bacterium]